MTNAELSGCRRRSSSCATLGGAVTFDRSELLREALHHHLVRLRAESDIEAWQEIPLTADEHSFGEIAGVGSITKLPPARLANACQVLRDAAAC